MNPELLIIDDMEDGRSLAEHKIRLSLFPDLVGGSYEAMNEWGDVNIDELYDINRCERLLEWFEDDTAEGPSRPDNIAVVLDMSFQFTSHDYRPPVWDCILQRLESLPQEIRFDQIDEYGRGFIAVLDAMLHSPWLKKAVVLVATSHSARGVENFINDFNAYCVKLDDSYPQIILGSKLGVTIRDDAKEDGIILTALKELWQDSFPSVHPLPWVNHYIVSWLRFYENLPPHQRIEFCTHGHIKENKNMYNEMLHEMLGDSNFPIKEGDQSSLKAMFMIRDEREEKEPYSSKNRHEDWGPILEGNGRRLMLTSYFQAILQTACKVKIDVLSRDQNLSEISMPVMPSFIFIASLHILLEALRKEETVAGEKGILEDAPLTLAAEGSLFRLSIPLKPDPDKAFLLAARWEEKLLGGFLNPDKSNSVCAEVWNLYLGRVVRISQTSLDYFEKCSETKKTLLDGQKELLKLFEGPGRPVVAVGFAPHKIQLYWSVNV